MAETAKAADIVITKDEKENAIMKMVDDRIVATLTDRRTIEAIREKTGHDPRDPRQSDNFQRWNQSLGAFPAGVQRAAANPRHSEAAAMASAIAKAFIGEDGSERRAHTESWLENAKNANSSMVGPEWEAEPNLVRNGVLVPNMVKVKGGSVVQRGYNWGAVAKTAEVTTVSDIRLVAGTEYDPEIYGFPFRKVNFEDLLKSKPLDKGSVQFLQEYGYSGSPGYGLIPGNEVSAVAEVDDPASPLSLTDSTVEINNVLVNVSNLRTKITVASELLDDINELTAFLEKRIQADGEYTMSTELASGSGTGAHMLGFYVDPLVQAYAWSSGLAGDTQADAVLHGIILAWLAEHEPDNIPMSPYDWGAIIALKNSIQSYLIPSAHQKDNAKTLWGLPVVPTTANPESYCMPGSWQTSALFRDRQKTTLTWTKFYGTDMDSNLVRLFLNRRAALQKLRPEGFVAVHFDAAPAGS